MTRVFADSLDWIAITHPKCVGRVGVTQIIYYQWVAPRQPALPGSRRGVGMGRGLGNRDVFERIPGQSAARPR